MNVAWTQADIDAISAALMRGEKSVTWQDGRRVDYHTLDEMRRLRSDMKAEVAASRSQVVPVLRTTVGRIRR
jgi:hypothetical protein